jgi:hypothetical protein
MGTATAIKLMDMTTSMFIVRSKMSLHVMSICMFVELAHLFSL